MGIIDDIYNAMLDEAAYAHLPFALSRFMNARSAILIDAGPDGQPYASTSNHFSDEMNRLYIAESMHEHDVWLKTSQRLRVVDATILTEDFVSADQFVGTYFFQRMYRQFGDDTARCIGAAMRHSDGISTVALHRAHRDHAFGAQDAHRLDGVLPHLKRLNAVRAKLRAKDAQASLREAAIDGLSCAMFVTDSTGTIQLMNVTAEAMLTGKRGISLISGKLSALDSALSEQFALALKTAATRSGSRGGAMRMPDAQTTFQVLVAPLPGQLPSALVLITDTNPGHLPSQTLKQLYGLTAAEADLAALLAQGCSPAEAANSKSVSLATIRTQIQKLFGKMEAGSITDIVRVLSRLPPLSS